MKPINWWTLLGIKIGSSRKYLPFWGEDIPEHQTIGLTSDKWARTLSGLRFHRNLPIPGLQQQQCTLQAAIDHVHNLEGQDKASAIELWIERILDASQGYRVAHNYTRDTPKAPPLPSGMWHKGEYLGHAHQIAQAYLQQWGNLWCQGEYPSHQELWTAIRTMIRTQ